MQTFTARNRVRQSTTSATIGAASVLAGIGVTAPGTPVRAQTFTVTELSYTSPTYYGSSANAYGYWSGTTVGTDAFDGVVWKSDGSSITIAGHPGTAGVATTVGLISVNGTRLVGTDAFYTPGTPGNTTYEAALYNYNASTNSYDFVNLHNAAQSVGTYSGTYANYTDYNYTVGSGIGASNVPLMWNNQTLATTILTSPSGNGGGATGKSGYSVVGTLSGTWSYSLSITRTNAYYWNVSNLSSIVPTDLHTAAMVSAGYTDSNARAVYGSYAVGQAYNPAFGISNSQSNNHALLWNVSNTSNITYADLNGSLTTSNANAVSTGITVGSGAGASTGGSTHAFEWDNTTHAATDLNNYLPTSIIYSNATSVDPGGTLVLVNGSDSSNTSHNFLMIPVTSGTSAAFASGTTTTVGSGSSQSNTSTSVSGTFNVKGSYTSTQGFTQSGTTTVASSGSVQAQSTYSQGSGTTTVSGTLVVTQGFTQTGGATTINAAGLLTATGGLSEQGGTITDDGTITGNVGVSGGTLKGSGAINGSVSLLQTGIIAPGNSPGALTVNGNYTQSGGTLQIELGGRTQGTQYDFVKASGTATLGGTLQVSFYNGFVPAVGDSFYFMDYSSSSGIFSQITGPANYNWLVVNGVTDPNTGAQSSRLTLQSIGSSASAPEPATLVLALGGLASVSLPLRRRLRRG